MSSPAFEAFLARLYADEAARERFLRDPRGEAGAAGLTETQTAALEQIDRDGLRLAAHSFARKRASKAGRSKSGAKNPGLLARLWNH